MLIVLYKTSHKLPIYEEKSLNIRGKNYNFFKHYYKTEEGDEDENNQKS